MSSTEPPAGDDALAGDPEAPGDDESAAEAPVAEAAADVDEPDGDGAEATTGPAPQTPVDDARQVVLDALSAELGEDLLATEVHRDDVWLRVDRGAWRRSGEVCRSIGFDYFCFLSGIDWMPATSITRGEVASEVADDEEEADQADAAGPATAEVEPTGDGDGGDGAEAGGGPGAWKTGYAGGDTRFQVFARLYSIERHMGLTLKADLDDDAPAVETWSEVYPGADWHERETWEMYGFDFVGHPHLVHLYLPGEFEGFPLRKDFPLLAREVKPWPGLVDVEPMPESDEESAEPAAGDDVVASVETAPATGEGA